jgi:hypothetical protein
MLKPCLIGYVSDHALQLAIQSNCLIRPSRHNLQEIFDDPQV